MPRRWRRGLRPGETRRRYACVPAHSWVFAVFFLAAVVLAVLTAGPASATTQEPPALFVDVSERAGIGGNRQGDDRAIGQAWADYNGDGWLDLYVTDTAGPNTLYESNGDGTFRTSPLADEVALPDAYSGGAVFADYDNDGWRDLYVVNWGANVLFRNEGGAGFTDVTATAGVGDEKNGQTASWGDYDGDGFLDLYVANWSCHPRCGRPSTGDSDRLYHNNGDGTFEDVTALLGSKTVGAGFVASFVDYDNDGDLDIYLVNDEFINPVGNMLWRNDGPGCDGWCFTEVAEAAGADTRLMGMGLATGDYDNDGDLDFYFSNAGPMALLQNQGGGLFRDVAEESGVAEARAVGWGAVFFDCDNDGWQDLYLAVMDGVKGRNAADPLFHNQRDGSFRPIANSGLDTDGRTLGVAYADYNRDGWVDLLVGNHDGEYHLSQNRGAAYHDDYHWLALALEGGGPINRDAVGARAYVATPGGRTQMQEVKIGSSLGSGNDTILHFGLGRAEAATSVRLVWPDGREQIFHDVAGDRFYHLRYPTGPEVRLAQMIALYGPTFLPVGAAAAALGALALAGIGWWLWRRRSQDADAMSRRASD
ncbi:MAG: CRTAC1 family protein [Candidatus Promineifilaceae bacterium]|nr:CRTAC1 family protein [Candidatus Promineifilaceae bacterium]